MKYAFAAVALAALARAQTLADVPKCAIPCLDKSIADNTSCETTDLACVCESFDKVQGDATTCVIKECGAEVALNDVLPAAQKLCENPPAASSSAAPATSAAAATTSEAAATTSEAAATSSEAAATTSEAAATTSEAAASSSVVVIVDPVPTPQPEETTTAVVSPPSDTGAAATPVPTAGAATLGSVGALAMVVLGAIAL